MSSISKKRIFQEGGQLPSKKRKIIDKEFSEFVKRTDADKFLQDKARLNYYNQRLDSTLLGKDFDKINTLRKGLSEENVPERIAHADSLIRSGKYNTQLNPDQIQKILGKEQYGDYVGIKSGFVNPERVKGTVNPDPMIYGLRNSFAAPIPAYESYFKNEGVRIADFRTDMNYTPEAGYKTSPRIMSEYEYGGYMMPQYGFGSWLKENAGGLLKGASSLVSLIPGVGQIAGPILNVAGAAVGGIQANKKAQKDADAQQKLIDEKVASDKKGQFLSELDIREQNLFGEEDKNINYGATFGYGGDLMMQPQITEYSEKANLHSEGIGGVPVDAKGNPAKVSKTSAVGMTEGGEVTWNGYVFSNKLKTKK